MLEDSGLHSYVGRVKALKGHFDGQHVVLDEPATLKPNCRVTVVPVESSQLPTPEDDPSRVEEEFGALSQKWRHEIGAESSLSKITGNLNYLRIIALGRKAVPLILRELQKEPAPWFLALRVITGEDTVGRNDAGNFSKMADAWLIWGRERGYI